MKKKRFLLLHLSLLLVLGACKNEASTSENAATTATTATAVPTNPSPPIPVLPEVEAINQKQPLTTYMINKMTKDLWHYSAVVVINNPEKSKSYFGKWIKFNADNTILHGFYGEAGDKGRWAYDEGKDIITIAEGGNRPAYSQWKVQTSSNSDNLLIWVGTTRFQNNGTQMKMVRRAEKPMKNEE